MKTAHCLVIAAVLLGPSHTTAWAQAGTGAPAAPASPGPQDSSGDDEDETPSVQASVTVDWNDAGGSRWVQVTPSAEDQTSAR